MGRAFGAVGWVVTGALIGAVVGVVVGLLAGAMVVGISRPRGRSEEDFIGFTVWAIACGTSTIVGGLAGAAGGVVWGLTPERPRPRLDDDRPSLRDRDY